jgi:hypothetical protein
VFYFSRKGVVWENAGQSVARKGDCLMAVNEVLDMQIRVFRKFQMRHHLKPKDALRIFEANDILGFISECYELLHVSGDEYVLNDIDAILAKQGVNL